MIRAILCVDDEPIVLTSLKTQLNTFFGNEYDIELAQSAEDALEIMEELKEENIEIELIISDFFMPGMKGDEFLIKAQSLLPKTKKLLLRLKSVHLVLYQVKSSFTLQMKTLFTN